MRTLLSLPVGGNKQKKGHEAEEFSDYMLGNAGKSVDNHKTIIVEGRAIRQTSMKESGLSKPRSILLKLITERPSLKSAWQNKEAALQ